MNNTAGSGARAFWIRIAAFVLLLCVSAFALPVSAYIVEAAAPQAENWILVLYLVLMTAAGALVGRLLPPLTPAMRSTRRRVLTWAGAGVLAAVVGYVVWFLLLAG
ncbi:MAG TPA: hypothetical protein VM307_04315 [Egibacteraceae bacterium]|nr:hypothetical protein [Egibacteraceae bacterium]